MLADDPVRDRKPSPVPLPSRRLVKNGSKMFSRTSGLIPQPLSVKTISAIP